MPSANPVPSSLPDPVRQLLRHALATLAYRGGKAVRNVPENFSSFSCGGGCRSAGQILAHIGDLLDWSLSMARGNQQWHDSKPQSWTADVERLHTVLAAFDTYLASEQPLQAPIENLFQGPIADALTHVGQIVMMRRLAGSPVKSENFFAADITRGRVGPEQASPKFEF